MDPIQYMTEEVAREAVTYDVYRVDSSGPYNDDPSKVETAEMWVYSGSVAEQMVIEGVKQDTTLVGLIVAEYDKNGDLTETIEVGDELRLQSDPSKRYDVLTKEGHPDHVEPDIWQLALERANSSS